MTLSLRAHPRRTDEHIVDCGLVHCPVLARDVEVDRCFQCSAFRGLTTVGTVERLYCHPRSG